VTVSTERPLYAHVLGPAWEQLPESLQRLHQTFAPASIAGRFEVRHGKTAAMRVLARLLRLPPEADPADITLTVEQRGALQRWVRRFGADCVVTNQCSGEDRLLAERFGILQFQFELKLGDGQLVYHQRRVALCLACCSLRLPAWIAPVVSASEKANGDSVEVSVEVRLPLIGLLLAYGGTLWPNHSS